MRKPLLAMAAAAAVVVFAVQVSLPPALAGHATRLKEAQGLKAKLLVNEVGGAQTTVEITYAKPNLLKIDGPATLALSDGKTLTVLDKAKNTYTQVPLDQPSVLQQAAGTEVWGWASFFQSDPAKLFKSAKAGAARKFRGVDTTEVTAVTADDANVTLFIETKTGVARGYQFATKEGKQFIVFAETIESSAAPAAADSFAFTAPAGATKLEPGAIGDVSWAQVATIFNRNCMPCHGAAARSGTLDLSDYAAVSTHRFVIKGDAKNSILALALRAAPPKRMPQGRPPLSEDQIKTIEAWINGGLKP